MSSKVDIIRKVYENPETGFVGGAKLYRKIKELHPRSNVTQADIKKFLTKQDVKQQFKKSNQQGSFIAFRPKQEYQVDLIYLKNPGLNGGNKYAMVAVDAFTKQCHIEMMKSRKAKERDSESVVVMEKILKRMGDPESVYSDEGSEFTSQAMKSMLEGRGIKMIFTTIHATMVERVNRTIKEMIDVYLRSTNSKTITKVLPKVLLNYNGSFHRSIGMTPNQAATAEINKVRANLEIASKRLVKRPVIKEGDAVRHALKPTVGKKTYARPKFSAEVHEVKEKDGGEYTTDHKVKGKNKTYLRAHLLKVDAVETSTAKADLQGTLEGRLKVKGGLRARGKTRKVAGSTAAEDRKTKPARQRKQVDSGFFVH